MQLTPDNYHSLEADNAYMSVHGFNAFMDPESGCPAREVARLKGEGEPQDKTAYQIGRYVDCTLTTPAEFPTYVEANQASIYRKDGKTKLADYVTADAMIARVLQDADCRLLLEGEPQRIVTATFGGIAWKAMIDVDRPDDAAFTELKTARDFSDCWLSIQDAAGEWRRQRYPWYERYWRQMSMYSHFRNDAMGAMIAVTKQMTAGTPRVPAPRLAKIVFANETRKQRELAFVLDWLPLIVDYRRGDKHAPACRHCEWCAANIEPSIEMAVDLQGTRPLPRWTEAS